MSGRALVAGSLGQRPGAGGHAWVFLQYLLGLRRLGWNVLFVDRLEPEMCFDASGNLTTVEGSVNLRYLADVMDEFGLADAFAILHDRDDQSLGRSRAEVLHHARGALLVNVMGFLDDDEILSAAGRRVFLDIDPGFGQMWRELGLADVFGQHDHYVTIGESIGGSDCTIPTCGIDWITTRPPVVLDQWPFQPAPRSSSVTSIASWRGPFGPIDYEGRTYGLRVHEFRKFMELPRRTGQSFELALDIHESDAKDLAALVHNGWGLVDPRRVAGEPASYRDFIQRSRTELMVAKNMYVQTNSGWFSDRSVCYLASGRPVVAQDTGWTENYQSGKGLLSFSTLDEAAAALEDLGADYEVHCRAARLAAEEHFDSDKVLTRLLADIGVG